MPQAPILYRLAILGVCASLASACSGGGGGAGREEVDADEDVARTDVGDAGTDDSSPSDATDASTDVADAAADVIADVETGGDSDATCADADADGLCDADDNCPDWRNPDQADVDGDGLGDVCDIAPGTPGEGEPDGIALVGGAPTEFVTLEWNDEQVVVLIPQPGTYETFTLVVESPGDADFGAYRLYRGGSLEAELPAGSQVVAQVEHQLGPELSALRLGSLTWRIPVEADGSGEPLELPNCRDASAPCATIAADDGDDNGVPESWRISAELGRTGQIALVGAVADAPPSTIVDAPDAAPWPGNPPTDPGLTTATWDEQIRAQAAWFSGSGGERVAVIAEGFPPSHPDLPLDSGDGLGALINGHDYLDDDEDSLVNTNDLSGAYSAGLVAARANAIGIAGIAHDSQVLAIRGMGGTITQLAAAIDGAVAAGARIIAVIGGTDTETEVLRTAVEGAVASGALIVNTAGGFSGGVPGDRLRYPAAYPGVLAVTAVASDGRLLDGARWGGWVDLAAPGENVYSLADLDGYDVSQGTPPAAAIVAGAAAVVWSLHPEWTADRVAGHLVATGAAIPELGERGTFPALDLAEAALGADFMAPGTWWTSPTVTVGQPDWLDAAALDDLGSLDLTMMALSTDDELTGTAIAQLPITIPSSVSWTARVSLAVCTDELPAWLGLGFDDRVTITAGGNVGRPSTLFSRGLAEFTGWSYYPTADGRIVGCTRLEEVVLAGPSSNVTYVRVSMSDIGDGLGESWLLVDSFDFSAP